LLLVGYLHRYFTTYLFIYLFLFHKIVKISHLLRRVTFSYFACLFLTPGIARQIYCQNPSRCSKCPRNFALDNHAWPASRPPRFNFEKELLATSWRVVSKGSLEEVLGI